jgi:hypothetical protein
MLVPFRQGVLQEVEAMEFLFPEMAPILPFLRHGLLPKEEACEFMLPHFKRFEKCWTRAIGRWNRQSEDMRARLSSSPLTHSSVLRTLAVSFAKELFPDGVDEKTGHTFTSCEKLGFYKLYIAGDGRKVVLRFHIVLPDLVVRNLHASEQKENYFKDVCIDGIENDASRLTVGCVLDEARMAIGVIGIAHQYGDRCDYSFKAETPSRIKRMPVRSNKSRRIDRQMQARIDDDQPRVVNKPR